ncbi:hypothetical protein N865_12165 [Intrasporangium oryzae NRRL B-24470]|uniref:Uncharacterized protein n=1 Tax=Intrasporangium oryzae NRRL B-24470 TaxID=1386089 RepID=W9G4N0_9MICO|nr:DUF2017 family protein [Intrasporangium oryzae]EWT00975.1 hypothetical protein N865_12165 [Intrasporangium oryzae NRRL B-24470]
MARAFLPDGRRFVALLDEGERAMLSGLMEQTRVILSPEIEPTGDAFADVVASMGLSLAAQDQRTEVDTDADAAHEQHADDSVDGAAGRGGDGSDDGAEALGDDLTDRDPALDRLLPTAHRGDDQVAAEFRRLTEEGLRQRKSANLDVALERLAAAYDDRVELDAEQAPRFLMALTDVRLLLAERMGMRTEEDAEALHAAMEVISDEDPLGYAMAWYDFMTWLQETLTSALMGEPFDRDLADDEDDDAADDEDDGGRQV